METVGGTIQLQSKEDRLSKPHIRIPIMEDDADIRCLTAKDFFKNSQIRVKLIHTDIQRGFIDFARV